MRHPNLVTLIGTCSEKSALVYEYLPNGSLEDRLARQGGTPPLLFLHSNNLNPIVHGDLKPANILLDANLVSTLSEYGTDQMEILLLSYPF
jgi:serine/threonine protein kinase